jgi:hypothetical protein
LRETKSFNEKPFFYLHAGLGVAFKFGQLGYIKGTISINKLIRKI